MPGVLDGLLLLLPCGWSSPVTTSHPLVATAFMASTLAPVLPELAAATKGLAMNWTRSSSPIHRGRSVRRDQSLRREAEMTGDTRWCASPPVRYGFKITFV
ncbi:MAG TPA: hypothetical protein VFU49_05545 [Ktedonobacteraceae bacterium]|nr:hypothetical protein [Ktedonobacteraceae bacterium]